LIYDFTSQDEIIAIGQPLSNPADRRGVDVIVMTPW
jgi:hypothetical protein